MSDNKDPRDDEREEEVEGHSPRYLQENDDAARVKDAEKVEADDEDDVGGHRMY